MGVTNRDFPERRPDESRVDRMTGGATRSFREIEAAGDFRRGLCAFGIRGDGGRYPGTFYSVGSVAVDSKGNVYTGESLEGKRVQKFILKGGGR